VRILSLEHHLILGRVKSHFHNLQIVDELRWRNGVGGKLGFLWMMSRSSSRPAGRLVVRPIGRQVVWSFAKGILLFTIRGKR
jgi:hypothetical protein